MEKQGVHWSIRLQAYSALATRIQVQPVQGQTDPRLAPLWQCLDDYAKVEGTPGNLLFGAFSEESDAEMYAVALR